MFNILKFLRARKPMITPEQIEQKIQMVSAELEVLESKEEFATTQEYIENADRINMLNEVLGFLAEDKESLQDLLALEEKRDVESLCNYYLYGA